MKSIKIILVGIAFILLSISFLIMSEIGNLQIIPAFAAYFPFIGAIIVAVGCFIKDKK